MPEGKVILPLDSQRTFRVFENLIINTTKYAMPNTRVFIDIIENCLKYIVKDFEWHYRNLKEEPLQKLDGAGYGLF